MPVAENERGEIHIISPDCLFNLQIILKVIFTYLLLQQVAKIQILPFFMKCLSKRSIKNFLRLFEKHISNKIFTNKVSINVHTHNS